jgi:DNA-binding MarR family transcriptional regulator
MEPDPLDRAVRLWAAVGRGKVEGLTWGEFALLHACGAEGWAPFSVLTEALRLSPQRVSNLLTPLCARGLVLVEADAVDRRRRVVRLTGAGRETYAGAARRHARALEDGR